MPIFSTDYISLNISELKIHKSMNDHTTLFIRGMVDYDSKDNLEINKEITVKDGENENIVLFKGYINELRKSYIKQVCYCEIKAISYSKKIDIEKKYRVFQDCNEDYKEFFKKINGNIGILDKEFRSKRKNRVFIQYNETDWEFLNRIAAYNQVPVFYEDNASDPINGKINIGNDKFNHEISKNNPYFDYEEFYKGNLHTYIFRNIRCEDTGWKIGEILKFNEMELITYKIEINYKNGYLEYTYFCADYNELKKSILPYFNERIKGISLIGTVLEISNGFIYVDFKDEINRSDKIYKIEDPNSGKNNFKIKISSLYGADKGDYGFYVAPEKGDRILVYFYSDDEIDNIAIATIPGDSNQVFVDPNKKIIRTIDKKEIILDKDKIKITSKEKDIHLELNEKTIKLHNKNADLIIEHDKIILKNGKSEIVLDSNVTLKGKKIKLN